MEYSFHFYNGMAETGILTALNRLTVNFKAAPVVICIGSDLAIGDSLGPVVGTMLKRKGFSGSLYGTLNNPVTAKEVKYLNNFIAATHPDAPIIAIDAAVGEDSDVGLVKVSDGALKPGAGANKRLGTVGDVSILGIVAGKTAFTYSVLNLTRLSLVYGMAESISDAISSFFFKDSSQFIKRAKFG